MHVDSDLQQLIETLGTRNWRAVAEAERALRAAGDAGMTAVLEGMRHHPRPRVRRGCAGFLDHHGTDLCAGPLTLAALNDPVPNVRREAVHSLACDRCKDSPLSADAVPLLLDRITQDDNDKVRREAVFGLERQPRPDPRVVPVLRALIDDPGEDATLRKMAHRALRLHDPEYRAETDALARVAGTTRPLR